MTIYTQAVAQGVEIDNHSSDLYLPVTETTAKLVAEYKHSLSVTTFQSAIDGTLWYDVPFAYDPYFNKIENDIDAWACCA